MKGLSRKLWDAGVSAHTTLYRATGGRIGGRVAKSPVLLLKTVGRRTGKPRTLPLLYLADGDDLVVVASFGGAPQHPAWFLNLEAHPDVEVQIGGVTRPLRARRATPEERARLWPRVVEMYSQYADYQRRTTREIPLVILGGG